MGALGNEGAQRIDWLHHIKTKKLELRCLSRGPWWPPGAPGGSVHHHMLKPANDLLAGLDWKYSHTTGDATRGKLTLCDSDARLRELTPRDPPRPLKPARTLPPNKSQG